MFRDPREPPVFSPPSPLATARTIKAMPAAYQGSQSRSAHIREWDGLMISHLDPESALNLRQPMPARPPYGSAQTKFEFFPIVERSIEFSNVDLKPQISHVQTHSRSF